MSTLPPENLPPSLVESIREARVVSFNIFDTTLVRATENPVDLFMLLAQEAGLTSARAFALDRIGAEKRTRRELWESRQAVEVTLPEIYDGLAAHPEWNSVPLPEWIERERSLELRVCRRHPVMGPAYDWAMQIGKRVGFMSDTYLDVPLIESMLEKCSYRGYEFLLVSSRAGTTKASGGLYQKLCQQLAIHPSEILHIGDNLDSDFGQARAVGFKVFHIPKCSEHLPMTPAGSRFARCDITALKFDPCDRVANNLPGDIWSSLVRGLVAAHQAQEGGDFWYHLGYTHVGILLLGFALWLDRTAAAEGVTCLYFLSRDGHIMHRVHQILRERGMACCAGRYLHASRRAWNVPALTVIDEKACDFLVSGTSRLPVGGFLSRLNLSVSESLAQIHAAGFESPEHIVASGEDYGRLRALFRSLAPKLLTQAEAERERLHDYFVQEQVFQQGHVGLVNIGWHGSLQESFSRLLSLFGRDIEVTGFYLGTFEAAKARVAEGARQFAYLCEGGEPAERLRIIWTSVQIFEWIFSAPHGSVLGFRRTPEGVAPILESGNLDKDSAMMAARMQVGALRFIEDALDCFLPSVEPPPIPAGLGVAMLADLLHRPTREEASNLGDLLHTDGFGEVLNVRHIARPLASPYQLSAWPGLLNGYRAAFWRRGYLRRLWPDSW